MGNKINPSLFRGKKLTSWYVDNRKDYSRFISEDDKIRNYIYSKFKESILGDIHIYRTDNKVNIVIYACKPLTLINFCGKKNNGIEMIKSQCSKISNSDINTVVMEIKDPDMTSIIVAQKICNQIERRMPVKSVIKSALSSIMSCSHPSKKVLGARLEASGRINGAEIARREIASEGMVPLQSINSEIDYASATAHTLYGSIGVKVFIYKKDKI